MPTNSPSKSLIAVQAMFDRLVDLPPDAMARELETLDASNPGQSAAVRRLLALDAEIGTAEPPLAVTHAGVLLEQLGGPPVQAGTEVGAYRVQEEIGSGGMGRVYRAVRDDGTFEREVAIKLIRRDLVSSKSMERFAEERRLLAALDHPGIVRLLDAGTLADGAPFVAMELVRGESLVSYCDARKLGMRDRVALFRQVLDAVAHAHRHLIVHRDLKPENILVDDQGQVRLLDFGIAKALDSEAAALTTATGDRYLTPAYAAPEQLRGDALSTSCDVYALGLVLYELLAGGHPFADRSLSAAELERAILLQPPPPLAQAPTTLDPEAALRHGTDDTRAWRRGLRGDLDAIVQRALRKEPATRFGSAGEFAAEIDAWRAGRALASRQTQGFYRARKFVARNRLAVGAAVAGLLLLVSFTAIVVRQNLVLAQERDETALQRDRARMSVQILQEAFESADPGRTGGSQVSARSVLEAARARLPQTAQDNPGLALELAFTIASVQIDLGLGNDALSTIALTDDVIARHPLDPTGRVEHELLRLRAQLSVDDYASAQRTMTLTRSFARPEDAAALASALGQMLMHAGRLKESIVELRKAVVAYAMDPAQRREWVANSWSLANALRLDGEDAQALEVLETTLERLKATAGADHPHTLETQLRRASVLRFMGFAEQALGEVRLATESTERIYGRRSMAAATARTILGNVLTSARDYAGSEREYRLALAAWPPAAGENHTNLFRIRFNLAQALAERASGYAESEAMFRDLIVAGPRLFGPQHRTTYILRARYGFLLNQQSRFSEALAIMLPPEVEDADAGWREMWGSVYFGPLEVAVDSVYCRGASQSDAGDAPGSAGRDLCRQGRRVLDARRISRTTD